MSDQKTCIRLGDIPDDIPQERRWKVILNGQEVNDVNKLEITSKFGDLVYGLHPAGYPTWGFHENGGGGAVTIPYVVVNDHVYVGVLEQSRPFQNPDVKVLGVVRGFLDPGKNHFEQAAIELTEELGVEVDDIRNKKNGEFQVHIEEIAGNPGNCNNAFFIMDKGEGLRYFSAEMLNVGMQSSRVGVHPHDLSLVITREEIRIINDNKLAEQIVGSRFIHWAKATLLGDNFTVAAVAKLMGHLELIRKR